MRVSSKVFWSVMGVAAVARLFSMAVLPLADTSEPRYAEVARLMAQTNDWITPWFEPGVPFWGKPPLAFWAQALSIKLFGVSEFAVRLPAFLAMAALLAMVYSFARGMFGQSAARWSALVLATMLLPLLSAGAVLTDPFLAFAVTLSMLSFISARRDGPWYQGLGFFLGLGLGMLAKGPLAVVLIGGVCAGWMLWQRDWRGPLRALPWGLGIPLAMLVALPWYVAAEFKTPGFLQYFIVGEHFLRFVDSGWEGDLYGTAHARALGAIWLDWIGAAAPWSILIIGAGVLALFRPAARQAVRASLADGGRRYLLLWAIAAPALFTLSGNILWTYVLPSLPAVALLLGCGLAAWQPGRFVCLANRALLAGMLLVPSAAAVLSIQALGDPLHFKTEKGLVQAAAALRNADQTLYYVGERPFSARYYSAGTAVLLPWDTADLRPFCRGGGMLTAVRRDRPWPMLAAPGVTARAVYSSKRYTLYEIQGCAQ
ncbi:dolichyl-phosphate-mannose-protein mannosyltransferase [Bordetella ansorpii]|uniref:Dolichyl-phosphate-mannose-protein mannosyltransferase n=2 Tax=Bordetella ansorpii TaxID=288768 RepID=A0A157S5B2_9BORD|nr:dolichyl-phosphate-mannose-protein mannosyltransferase [Bordetella ansorpii]